MTQQDELNEARAMLSPTLYQSMAVEIERLKAKIAALEAELAKPDTRSFGEVHPRNPNAKCDCEHWAYCKECHPTAFLGAKT